MELIGIPSKKTPLTIRLHPSTRPYNHTFHRATLSILSSHSKWPCPSTSQGHTSLQGYIIHITTPHSYTLHTATPLGRHTIWICLSICHVTITLALWPHPSTEPHSLHRFTPLFILFHACYCPNSLLSVSWLVNSPSLPWKLEVWFGLGGALGTVAFPFTRRELWGTAHSTGRVTWENQSWTSVGHFILLTIPTPSKVKIAVPKNNKKVFQLATRGRWLWCGIWKRGRVLALHEEVISGPVSWQR